MHGKLKENIMVYAIVVAGGVGSRMGNIEKPKQYLTIGDKPIIVHTLEKFYVNETFKKIVVPCPAEWILHTENLVKKYLPDPSRVAVVEGGATRNETIMNAIKYIEETDGIDDDTIIVTHDSVRPFVTHRMIDENIKAALEVGACDTVIPATDTIVEAKDGQFISNVPERKLMYQGQTPQSFKAKKLKELYYSLTDAEKEILTDACKIFAMKGEKVKLVNGEVFNIKITYPYDLKVAQTLIGEEEENA